MFKTLCLWAFLVLSVSALGREIPVEYIISPSSLSPNHRYGVRVPVFSLGEDSGEDLEWDVDNALVELETGCISEAGRVLGTSRVLARLLGEPGWNRDVSHHETLPARWSPDSSVLIWEVAGKWFADTLVVVKIEKGEVKWQVDVLKTGQQAMLARVKKAAPKRYAEIKKAHEGWGSAYPDGFAIDVQVLGPKKFPLRVFAYLTDNTKGESTFNAGLEAVLTASGEWGVKDFWLGAERKGGPPPPWL